MSLDVLTPVNADILAFKDQKSPHCIENTISIHTQEEGIPDLKNKKLAIIGVLENRNTPNENDFINIDGFRKSFYNLFPGHWHLDLVDLGDIKPGHTFKDTCFALKSVLSFLYQKHIIPVIIGGTQALTYVQYRAFDDVKRMVNLVNIDSRFDMGNFNQDINSSNFVSHCVLEQPYNLFNYTTIGYQTFYNSQEEIELMEQLSFEAYRLGEATDNLQFSEPLLRDANIVSIDASSIQSTELSKKENGSANGFYGREICALTRYAGISEKVSSFSCCEFNLNTHQNAASNLLAQMIWYFIEGVNFRVQEDFSLDTKYYQKFSVLLEEKELIFFKSLKTQRWWLEIPFFLNVNNKLKKQALLPCTWQDYEAAMKGKLPERWLKAIKKNAL